MSRGISKAKTAARPLRWPLPAGERAIRWKKSFDKALDAPRTGEWLKIFYRPDTDEWIFCREVRPWWTLQLLSGAVFVTVGAVVAVQGWDFLAQLNGFTMEQKTSPAP